MTDTSETTMIGREMECEFALLCDVAEIAATGKLNITGVFGDFDPSGPYPGALVQAEVVAQFSVDPSEAGTTKVIRIEFTGPHGQLVTAIDRELAIPAPPPGPRSIASFIQPIAPLIFPEPGAYSFAIMVDGEVKTTISVHAHPAPTAPSSLN